jgi:thiol:disulfide interchange protein DsbA
LSTKKRSDARIARARTAIVALVAVLAIAIVGIGIYYTRGTAPDTFVLGTHFELLEGAPPRDPKRPIVVREFFSYYCVHCRNFDPQVESWRKSKPTDVVFERSPVVFSPIWRTIGQGYYALAATGALTENHPRLFRAIHDNNRQFLTPEALADFIDGHGVSREQFLVTFNSPEVSRAIQAADVRAREQRINSVPSLVVGDRYRVNLDKVPRAQAFDVVDFLIEELRAGR